MDSKEIILIRNNDGRKYNLGKINATFLADGDETNNQYSISKWTLAPNTPSIGTHSHEEHDDIFLVLDGTLDFYIHDKWIKLNTGDFIRVPINIQHDFCNNGNIPVVVLNIYIPGGFEKNMPEIVEWFKNNN